MLVIFNCVMENCKFDNEDFPKPMKISSSNFVNDYSTNSLAENSLSKQTVGTKYFALAGGEEGLVGYEGQVV